MTKLRKIIINTRPEGSGKGFHEGVESNGFTHLSMPCIKIAPLITPEREHAIQQFLSGYFDWVVFTSGNAVRYFAEGIKGHPLLPKVKFAVQGDTTERELQTFFFSKPSLKPSEFVSEAMISAFESVDLKGKKILFPSAKETRDVVRKGLIEHGAEVTHIPVYETLPQAISPVTFKELCTPEVKEFVISFFSPSAAKSFFKGIKREELPAHARIASIGPVTSRALQGLGVKVDIEARNHTEEGLLEAISKVISAD